MPFESYHYLIIFGGGGGGGGGAIQYLFSTHYWPSICSSVLNHVVRDTNIFMNC